MRLCTFSVQNFKQFRNLTLDLSECRDFHFNTNAVTDDQKLIKTGLIYGRNASGKTNLGLAVMDITRHLSQNHIPHDRYKHFLNADSSIPYATFSYVFSLDRKKILYIYKKDKTGKLRYEEIRVDGQLVCMIDRLQDTLVLDLPGKDVYGFESLQWERFRNSSISIIRYIEFNSALEPDHLFKQLILFVDKMLMFSRLDRGNQYLGFNPDTNDRIIPTIQKNGMDRFNAFLKDAGIDEEVIIKKDINGDDSLFFRHTNEDLPLDSVGSSGTMALILLYAWLILLDKASFVFIDEFDAFYHFELSRFVFRRLKEKKAQCLLTTHNLNLLTNNITRPDACFIITKDDVASLSQRSDRELREGHNLEKLYVANEFGTK